MILIVMLQPLGRGQLVPNLGGQRAGISALQFLKIGVGGRGSALGEAFVAISNDVSSLYWNPAGLTQFEENAVYVSHTNWLVDIRHQFLGVGYHLGHDDHIGLSITSLHMDDMEVTTETQPLGTGRYFKFGDLAVGLSYARRMTDQFSFGVTAKYVEETLDVLKMRGVLFDLGTYYWTGIGSMRFAVVVSNFGGNVEPNGSVTLLSGEKRETFQSFSPPTLFKIGFAAEVIESDEHRLTTTMQLNHPNDNAENIRIGGEYEWNKLLALRAGVKRTIGAPLFGADNTGESDISLGLGIAVPVSEMHVIFDYAYSNFNRLGGVHRFSLGLTY